jgi:CheY-like chemotaxis protein/HPt (histidine-containing phosphotransfer) domain-containing protein
VAVSALLAKPVTPSTLLDACSTALGLAVHQQSRSVRREEALDGHRASLRGARILLVEDNAVNREVAFALLDRAGIVVRVACDGQEALEMLSREAFDGVLMDCQMPVLDGYAATRAIRQLPQFRNLPVIAMTANAMVGDRNKVLAAGMNDHIAKPIKVQEMFATLARWVRSATIPSAAAPAEWRAVPRADPPGIDVREGLAGMMGDEALYRHVLLMFYDLENNFAVRFIAARTAGNGTAATRMAHDLKSEAGTLGAHEVRDAATALEHACNRNARDEEIRSLVRDVDRVLTPVLAGLQEFAAHRAP